ncbi:MAG: hypothetical protein H0V29_00950 [Thermoleophilaceae bacterium]|nr:hypothetical protein [Thermoleophilaceae bacterium]
MKRLLPMPFLLAALLGPVSAAHAQAPAPSCQNASATVTAGYERTFTLSCANLGTAGDGLVEFESSNGTGVLTGWGSSVVRFRYTPRNDFAGTDVVTVRVKRTGVEIAVARLTLNVVANAGPVCTGATGFRTVPRQLQSWAPNCLDNDPTRGNATVRCCTYELVTPPVFGTATVNGTQISYQSTREDQPLDGFLLRATDIGGAVTELWVVVNIDLPFTGAPSERSTFLLSRSLTGGFPNGPSRNATISHDQRIARLMAFESDASDLVDGDSNGKTDVFLVHRARPWGQDGTPWTPGQTELVSRGMGGGPANGRSYGPSLDGDAHHEPKCVAFISEASNLVPRDTNGVADAFVRNVQTGAIERLSVGLNGRQANAKTTGVTIDGECGRASLVSEATNLAGRTRRKLPRAYARYFGTNMENRGKTGTTELISASKRGKPANGKVLSATISRSGGHIAFDSEATNLVGADRRGGADIYRKRLGKPAVDLVSRTDTGQPGNGPSTNPTITDQGHYVAYETRASDLAPGDTGPVSDIVSTRVGRNVRHQWISRRSNGASNRPTISGAGEFVLFDSDADNLKQSERSKDTNKERDVFLWNKPTGNVSRESRTPDNGPVFGGPSRNARSSSRGNYVAFESPSPMVDTVLLDALIPDWSTNLQKRVFLTSQGKAESSNQVYIRYLGPK